MANKLIGEIASKELITLQETQSCVEAANLMRQHNIGFIPVLNGTDLTGVLTDRDLALRIIGEQRPLDTMVKDVMIREIRSIEKSESVQQAAIQMARWKVRRMIVTDQGKLCGVVAIGDLAVRDSSDQMAGDALSRISSGARKE